MVITWAASTSVTSRTLEWPWIPVAVAIAIVTAAIIVVVRGRSSRPQPPPPDAETAWVANSEQLGQLTVMKKWTFRYRCWQGLAAAAAALSLLAFSVVAARPIAVETKQSTLASRDIVLCLDVSGSMIGFNREILDVFGNLVSRFDGERISLVVFDEVGRVVFPLTDDYALVSEQLEFAYEAMDPQMLEVYDPTTLPAWDKYLDLTAGTRRAYSEAASLIGDGLASCALEFQNSPAADDGATSSTGPSADPSAAGDGDGSGDTEERSRSIILATDNDLRGTPIYTLDEALELAVSLDIEINALYSESDWVYDPNAESKYRQAVRAVGGYYYYAQDPNAAEEIIERVQAQQAVDLGAVPEVTRSDVPGPWLAAGFLCAILAGVAMWRVRE